MIKYTGYLSVAFRLMNTQTKNRWLSWMVYIVLFLVVMQGVNWWKSRDAQSGNLSEFSGELMNGAEFTIAEFSLATE